MVRAGRKGREDGDQRDRRKSCTEEKSWASAILWKKRNLQEMANIHNTGLYTDESPGLKVDPVVVLVLSLGFIFSVVALHSTSSLFPSLFLPSLSSLSWHIFLPLTSRTQVPYPHLTRTRPHYQQHYNH